MAITIKDVAKLAKVSPSTVSRVISDNPRISDATKQVVYKAMEELNYQPNAIARSLANQSTQTIGLIIPNKEEDLFENPFFIQVMRGISLYSQKRHYKIMFNYSSKPEEELKFVKDFVNSRWVDGIVLLTAYDDDQCIEYLSKEKFPFVVVGRPSNLKDIMWVDNDNFQATYHVVNRLIQKGHTKIAFVGGPKNLNFSKDRLDGYKRALEQRNLSLEDWMIEEMAGFSENLGYEAIKRICQTEVPHAVVTTDDLLAFGVMKYNKEHDLNIKITGFNNVPLSAYQSPPLTSVEINAEELGHQAAKLLINSLQGEKSPINHYIVDTDLIERESTL